MSYMLPGTGIHGEWAFMQAVLEAAAQAVALDTPYDAVFVPLIDDLIDAIAGNDPATFLTAVEGRSRVLAAAREVRQGDVFVALRLGLAAFRAALSGGSPDETLASRRLNDLEGEALLRAAAGFSEGLEEAVDHLSRVVVELAPTDPETGVTTKSQFERRLAIELERCRRTEVGLGALLVAVVAGDEAGRRAGDDLAGLAGRAGRLLSAGVRRYDVVGRLGDLEFAAVLPDVSRRGVQAALERLHRALAGECTARHRGALRFVATYLDVADLAADDLMTQLRWGLAGARGGGEAIIWV